MTNNDKYLILLKARDGTLHVNGCRSDERKACTEILDSRYGGMVIDQETHTITFSEGEKKQ